jgi:hypothetical protein
MDHALDLGRANFDGNLMTEQVNDETETIDDCEIKAVNEPQQWKLIDHSYSQYSPSKYEAAC